MSTKTPRIAARIDAALKARIETVCKKTGLDESDLVRHCLIAVCNHVEAAGTLTLPLIIQQATTPHCDASRTAPMILNDRTPAKPALPTKKR